MDARFVRARTAAGQARCARVLRPPVHAPHAEPCGCSTGSLRSRAAGVCRRVRSDTGPRIWTGDPRHQAPIHPQPPPTRGTSKKENGFAAAGKKNPRPRLNPASSPRRHGPRRVPSSAEGSEAGPRIGPTTLGHALGLSPGPYLSGKPPRHASEASLCCSRTALRAAREPGVAGRERSEPVLQRFGL